MQRYRKKEVLKVKSISMTALEREFLRLLKHPLFWIVTLARCLGSLIFFFDPLWGFIVYIILDNLDGQTLPIFAGMSPLAYQIWDKYVDTVVYLAMLLTSIPYDVFGGLLLLFLYRFFGQIIFWQKRNERYLLFFPNIFEVVWLWFILGKQLNLTGNLNPTQNTIGLSLMIFLKVFQEFFAHLIGPKFVFPLYRRFMSKIFPWYARINPYRNNKN